jgi:hypothetical protein
VLEEQSVARFARGSSKRRRASLGIELRGDKDERRMWVVSPAVYGDYRVTLRGVARVADVTG